MRKSETACAFATGFAREGLKRGLQLRPEVGVNPLQFGFIGATDSHNSNPGDVEEYDWEGCCANNDAEVADRLDLTPAFAGAGAVARNPGGLVGVWAEENSRDSLFDSMVRRETFATSGPRIEPRFFAGWDLPADLCGRRDLVDTGYTLRTILDLLRFRGARSVKLCALLDKTERRQVEVPIDYCGFEIEDHFVVAYGLDYLDDVLVIDIGAGTVDLCRMHGTMPGEADQLTLECGDTQRHF